MKKTILLALTAFLLISSLTSCGSKDNTGIDKDNQSRILYSDDASSEGNSEENNETESDESKSKADSEDKDKDKDSETVTSKYKVKTASKTSDTSSKSTSSVTSKSPATKKNVTTTSVVPNKTTVSTVTSSNNDNSSTVESSEAPAEYDTESELVSETETDSDVTDTGNFDISDLTITLTVGSFDLGDNIESVKAMLGEPNDVQEAPSCKYDGQLDKTFIFNECSVNTYPNADGSEDYVVGVVITDPSYSTEKGAKIGTTSDELIKMYGNSADDTATMRRYVIDNKSLSFYVENDMVAEISYLWDN